MRYVADFLLIADCAHPPQQIGNSSDFLAFVTGLPDIIEPVPIPAFYLCDHEVDQVIGASLGIFELRIVSDQLLVNPFPRMGEPDAKRVEFAPLRYTTIPSIVDNIVLNGQVAVEAEVPAHEFFVFV